jgi:hypothetical protein
MNNGASILTALADHRCCNGVVDCQVHIINPRAILSSAVVNCRIVPSTAQFSRSDFKKRSRCHAACYIATTNLPCQMSRRPISLLSRRLVKVIHDDALYGLVSHIFDKLAIPSVRLTMPHPLIVLEHCPLFLQVESACPSLTSLI